MPKGYWVVTYRKISNPEQAAEYSKLAGPILREHGARLLTRGTATTAYELGMTERVVVAEFDSVTQAIATYECEAYQHALKVLGTAADRDFRIVEGVE
ncbi:MAG TPA: DUF1330 domain-containing protein [Pararobbsia sp.]|nr:DUF1330 domain-containing protein [Pararobbsia sp.]